MKKTIDINPNALQYPLETAASLLGMTPSALRWTIFNKRGPRSIRIGRRLYFRKGDLESWLESNLDEVQAG